MCLCRGKVPTLSVTEIGKVAEDNELSDSEEIDCIFEADIVALKEVSMLVLVAKGELSHSHLLVDDVLGVSVECFNVLTDAVLKFQLSFTSNMGKPGVHNSVGLWCYGRKAGWEVFVGGSDFEGSCFSLTNFQVHQLRQQCHYWIYFGGHGGVRCVTMSSGL